MVKNTAITKVFSGEMVRATNWDKDKYIVVNKDGQTVDEKGKPFNIVTAKEKKWEVYVKPAPVAGNTDNSELIKMIEALTEQVSDLQETIRTKDENVTVEQTVDSYEIADEVSQAVEAKVEQALKENMPQEEKSHEETVKIFYGVSSLKEVRELFKEELLNCNEKKDVMLTVTKYIPYCWMGGRKIKTVARYYADMRNVIKDVNDQYQDLALEMFSVPADVYERIKKADTEKVLEKIDSKETFDVEQIKRTMSQLKGFIQQSQAVDSMAKGLSREVHPEEYKQHGIPIAKQQTVQQARAYLYASYLALATGRRNTEILKSLELVKKRNVWYYKGLTKKGLPDTEIKAISLDNDFDFLKGLIAQIRKDVNTEKLTNQEVNSKYNHVFNRSFKRITGLNYTFHDAREIYAEIAYLDFGNKKGTEREEQDFKADILGHEIDKDRLVATDHYRTKKGE